LLELPLFANPTIRRSSGTKGFSNSKLFDLIDGAGLLGKAQTQAEDLKTFVGLTEWLSKNFVGRECKFLTKTTNKNTASAYSSVKTVVRFVPLDGSVVPEKSVVE